MKELQCSRIQILMTIRITWAELVQPLKSQDLLPRFRAGDLNLPGQYIHPLSISGEIEVDCPGPFNEKHN